MGSLSPRRSHGAELENPMSFTPDEQEKTVKIPVQVRAGQIQFYFDGPLPELKEGSMKAA